MKKVIMAAIAALAIVLVFASSSQAATPYTVDESGITLPTGVTFPDNGHVNINANVVHANLHFESKCITRTDAECAGAAHDAAQYIGESFIPWSAFGLDEGFCVSWVQISMYNEHYGEGGEQPICVSTTPTPTPTPTTSSTPTPTPTATETSTPTPTPTPTTTVSTAPTATPTPTTTTQPTASPTPSPTGTTSTVPSEGLAETGYSASIMPATIIAGASLLVLGLASLGLRKRRR